MLLLEDLAPGLATLADPFAALDGLRNVEKIRERLMKELAKHLPQKEIDAHFTPSYNPWDQRLCLVPDADLFEALQAVIPAPRVASLVFALAWVAAWFLVLRALFRRGVVWRV